MVRKRASANPGPHREACQKLGFLFQTGLHQEIRYCSRQRCPCPAGLTTGRRARARQSFSTWTGLSRLNNRKGRFCLLSILQPPSSMDAAHSLSQQRHGLDNSDTCHRQSQPQWTGCLPWPHRLKRPPPVCTPRQPGAATLLGSRNPGIRPQWSAPAHICNPTDEIKGHPRTRQSSIQNPGDGRSKTRRCIVPGSPMAPAADNTTTGMVRMNDQGHVQIIIQRNPPPEDMHSPSFQGLWVAFECFVVCSRQEPRWPQNTPSCSLSSTPPTSSGPLLGLWLPSSYIWLGAT